MDHRLPTHSPRDSLSPSLNSPSETDSFTGIGSISSHAGSTFSLIHRPESDIGSNNGGTPPRQSPPEQQYTAQQYTQQYTAQQYTAQQYTQQYITTRSRSGTFSSSPPTSPRVPVIKSMRPSIEKAGTSTSVTSLNNGDSMQHQKPHMIRGKWFYSRLRTIFYMFMWVAAATTFGLVVGVWAQDYLPYKDTTSNDTSYSPGGAYQEMPQGAGRGYRIRAWPENTELVGVYLIIAFCGTGMLVFFGLWLQNIYRSARSYYVLFTGIEYFSLAACIIWGCGFGAAAGYITYEFKSDNNENDFWSWTCTRTGRGQDIAFKRIIYYDGDCDLLTGSWATLLTLCGFSLLALLTFPANIIYHVVTRHSGYSRFDQKISREADMEDRRARRASLRPKEQWKVPKWAKKSKW